MPDVRILAMPPSERQILQAIGINETGYGIVSPEEHDIYVWECEDGRHIPIEQSTTLLTLHVVSAIAEEFYSFVRISVPGAAESIYVFDADLWSGSQVVVGVAGQERQDVINLFLRLVDQDESRIPNKIIAEYGTDLDKAQLLGGWKTLGIYKHYPGQFLNDYDACDFLVAAKPRSKRSKRKG